MKPEKILQSNILDIVFENRNKEYGAYELRKHYHNRLNKAVGVTFLLAIFFAASQSFKVPVKKGSIIFERGPEVTLTQLDPVIPEKPKEATPAKAIQKVRAATADYTKPIIVEDDKANKPMSDIETVEKSIIGTHETPGDVVTTEVGLTTEPPSTTDGSNGKGVQEETIEDNSPMEKAEFMPEFPGGKEAFIKFLQKNLNQPTDFEEGEKQTIVAQFVVDASGEVSNIQIVQQGRKDLEKEVVRVIKKMPRWKPGSQNGRNVPVFYKVPITFVAQD